MTGNLGKVAAVVAIAGVSSTSHAQYAPQLVLDSDVELLVEHVANFDAVIGPGFFGPARNIASPVAVQDTVYLIDQNDGIYRTNRNAKGEFKALLRLTDERGPVTGQPPEGLDLVNRQAVLNVSAGKDRRHLYVMHTSNTLPPGDAPYYGLPGPLPGQCAPDGEPANEFTCPDLYQMTPPEYQVLTEYRIRDDELVEPRIIATFATQSGPTHNGGGMLTLEDGRILYATGDALWFGLEGRSAAQETEDASGNPLVPSKILIIDPADGSFEVGAVGLRNVQRLMTDETGEWLGFSDIGGVTAEEVNFVPLADVLDTSTVENFGWGRNVDGFAREGTFYVSEGVAGVPETEPAPVDAAPVPESGFIQPYGQYGRDDKQDTNGGRASSGPVTSMSSFREIAVLWSDLHSGKAYFSREADLSKEVNDVYLARLVNEDGESFAGFNEFAGLFRTDPRLFRFPDGTAGVIFEATGDIYRLTELPVE